MDQLVLSENHTFLVTRPDGDAPDGDAALGLYHRDTRCLSELRLTLGGEPLTLLSSSDEDVYHATMFLTNRRLRLADGRSVPADTVGVRRSRVVSDGVHERLRLRNYNRFPLDVELRLELGADFADIFQVRSFFAGGRRPIPEPRREGDAVVFLYEGLDGVTRGLEARASTRPDGVSCAGAPAPVELPGDAEGSAGPVGGPGRIEPARARLAWTLRLEPDEEAELEIAYAPFVVEGGAEPSPPQDASRPRYEEALSGRARSYQRWLEDTTSVSTDNAAFDELLSRSALDLRALTLTYPTGRVVAAGIPWYAVPFGRDSLLTSLQALCFEPDLAAGALRFLAARQGERDDPERDEQPGKIMHELRFGELARAGVVPFTHYYGSVDSTPLFLLLLGEYVRWTADRELALELLPAARRALEWVDLHGDLDGDGYVEFHKRAERGIDNQGWKDSWDSQLHPDGSVVSSPTALVEVQAYVHAAKAGLAPALGWLGEAELGARLTREAAELRERFARDYWWEEEGYLAQALDAEKRPVRAVTSNPGHALMCGILDGERARRVGSRLLAPDMESGWGVRTRSASDPNYNPISYHNGSVWPHDNSLAILGLARCGLHAEANELAGQLLAASGHFQRRRLPELMCGYGEGETGYGGPAAYPVSCSPQAWAAGAPYAMLQGILGLEPDAPNRTLRARPRLPAWLGRVALRNLRVGRDRLDLVFTRDGVEVLAGADTDVVTE